MAKVLRGCPNDIAHNIAKRVIAYANSVNLNDGPKDVAQKCANFKAIDFGNADKSGTDGTEWEGVALIAPFDEPLLIIGHYANSYDPTCVAMEYYMDNEDELAELIWDHIMKSDILGNDLVVEID